MSSVSSSPLRKNRPIIVHEEDNLRLQCAATGTPPPTIVWEREDGKAIDWGKWKDNSKVGQSINITKINRIHMGNYICIADNAIPPAKQYTFQVEVHCKKIFLLSDEKKFSLIFTSVKPILRINHKWDQAISADFGSSITFKCEVRIISKQSNFLSFSFVSRKLFLSRFSIGNELMALSFPTTRQSIGLILTPSTRELNEFSQSSRLHQSFLSYIFNSSLTIHHINQNDYGEYYCVSKNIIGLEKIMFRLGVKGQFGRPLLDGDKPIVSGETPAVQSYEDVCPPQDACPFCPAPK